MNRKFLIRSAAGLAMATAAFPAVAQWSSAITVEVNGERVMFGSAPPQMVGGRVMVPLRGVMEKMGAYVDWDSAQRLVNARRGQTNLELRIGDRTAYVDGRPVTLDVPAMIIRGATMVPLRFMSEALGADVNWQAHTQTVRIDTTLDVRDPRTPPDPIPTSPATARINSFTHNAGTNWVRGGQTVTFELAGTANSDVTLTIPGVVRDQRMDEVSAGRYRATVRIEGDVATSNMMAMARLRSGNDERMIQTPIGLNIDAGAPTIRSIMPADGARLTRARPTISAIVDDGTGAGIERNDVKLFLDGRDVTSQTEWSEGFITFTPRQRLESGNHTARLEVVDRAGNRTTRTWNFNVSDRGDRNPTLTTSGTTDVRPGDEITLTVRAEPDAEVTYSIGDQIRDRAMRETSPGVYTAEYTVRRTDDFRTAPITARVRTRDGETYNLDVAAPLTNRAAGAPAVPTIVSPTATTAVGGEMKVHVRAEGADRFEVKVDYVTTVLGGLRMTGTVLNRIYDADARGELITPNIDLDPVVNGRNTEYTITVVAISPNGTRSEPKVLKVRR